MSISTYCRFTGALKYPNSPEEDSNPGIEIVEHLKTVLPQYGVSVRRSEDIEFAFQIDCEVEQKLYEVMVSYDWNDVGWWEISYMPSLSWWDRLFGKTETIEMIKLTEAISKSIQSLPGVSETRWYGAYDPNNTENYSVTPEL